MTELRKIAMQFISHHSMTTEEFVAAAVAEIMLRRNEGRFVHMLAEAFLNTMPAAGDGW